MAYTNNWGLDLNIHGWVRRGFRVLKLDNFLVGRIRTSLLRTAQALQPAPGTVHRQSRMQVLQRGSLRNAGIQSLMTIAWPGPPPVSRGCPIVLSSIPHRTGQPANGVG